MGEEHAKSKREIPFSWQRIGGLGRLAAFNGGKNGGGYGPVVTTKMVLSAMLDRNAVGKASLAEGITSFVEIAVNLPIRTHLAWLLTWFVLLVSVRSLPLCVYVFSCLPAVRLPPRHWGDIHLFGRVHSCENADLNSGI